MAKNKAYSPKEQKEIFRLMGFEDTEDMARNYNGTSPVKEVRHTETVISSESSSSERKDNNLSDLYYENLSFNGPI